ncbi:hypothetical protein M9H77_33931 [Catharanthus roseus]|uniref:Uncharacterized protein n=1 Tax=Catharanthus roseus TaxID=4058 RepID=A0ACB9ZKY2_CATRO|nr:hypothetical protein M9H77_33931 [Catharanthus roseus]
MSKIAGSWNKSKKSLPSTVPIQKKKAKNDGREQIGPAERGPQDPVLISSYNRHVAGSIWHGQERVILKSQSRFVSLTGWIPSDHEVSNLANGKGLVHVRSCIFQPRP